MILEAELPGIRFRAEPPAADLALPRMDVAAFVGFAASGPVGVPVAVEDAARFRDLFGGDPPLAWNAETGQVETAHLGAAVEDFFRNGGRRSWVVRVAGEGARIQRFPVPGLVQADSWEPAEVRARSAGSWADRLRAGAVLDREGLPLDPSLAEPFLAAPSDYRIHLSLPPGGASPGDLLELDFSPIDEAGPVLFLALETVTQPDPRRRGLLATARQGFWAMPNPEGLIRLAEADGLAAWDAIRLASPPEGGVPSVRRLTFELLAWEGEGMRARLGRLGFAAGHPRFWAALPADAELLAAPPHGVPATGPLAEDAAVPRFPFAGPDDPAPLYLPVAMRTAPESGAARGASTDDSPDTALERDGLAEFNAGLFLDSWLAQLGAGSLLAEANHRLYVVGEDLPGLYSLLPLEEVSLIAVPDAVHSGWELEAPETTPPLPAPELAAAPESDEGVELTWIWSGPADVTFRVEEGDDSGLSRAVRSWDGIAGLLLDVPPPDGCPAARWFRVRADRGSEAGPWSNTVRAVLPAEPFARCGEEPLPAPEPRLEPYGSPVEGDALVWPAVPGATGYIVEESADPSFADSRSFPVAAGASHLLPGPPLRTFLYRVRAERDGELGPWSITLRRTAPPPTPWRTISSGGEATVLAAVQRALLRFCCARGDLLALLALPRSFREEEVLDHLTHLTPGAAPEESPAGLPLFAPGGVPLFTDGERPVLGYGALYHPWIARRGAGLEAGGEAIWAPPEGAVAGTCAALARSRGAWIAPANLPLRDVVALDPPFSTRSWSRLLAVRVNLLRADPRGFLALSADTLSWDEEVRPVNVRRLLSLLRRLALREGTPYVFEPHDDAFRRRVWRRFDQLLAGMFVRGAFTGATAAEAYRVVVDASVNPPGTEELGRFVVELRVAPSRPMAFITVRLVQAGQEPPTLEEA